MRIRVILLLAAAIVGSISCGDPSEPPADLEPATVSITPPSSTTIQTGNTVQLSTSTQNKSGQSVVSSVTFTSSAPTIVSVTSAGLAKAEGSFGSADVTAHAGSVASFPVRLYSAPPAASCGQSTPLVFGAVQRGNLQASTCRITESTQLGNKHFNGPEPSGTWFYDLYTVDIPARATVKITANDISFQLERTLIGITPLSAVETQSFLDPLVLTNGAATTVQFQVLYTTYHAGTTGTYTIAATLLVAP